MLIFFVFTIDLFYMNVFSFNFIKKYDLHIDKIDGLIANSTLIHKFNANKFKFKWKYLIWQLKADKC